MHPSQIKKTITRTKKQLRKNRNKLHFSESNNDKDFARSEIARLIDKLSFLQSESNKI